VYIQCIYVSELLTVRIPKEIRAKMKKYSHINWSEVVRNAIIQKIEEEELKEDIRKAIQIMDSIRLKVLREQGAARDYDSSEVIRYWREKLS